MGKKITDYLLYRWRYVLGYSIISVSIVGLLLIAGLYAPGALSQAEIDSVVTSHQLSFTSLETFDPRSVVNLPYHILQRLSTELLGVTNFSIKLPSLVLGMLSALGMILLLQMWFRRNVAVLTTVLAITTGQFLFVAQNGTPSVVYMFWSVWLLLAAMMVSRRASHLRLWKITLFIVAALSLYTPLSIYILAALASAVILHPHLRYLVRQLLKAKMNVTIAALFGLVAVAPLIYAIVRDPSVGQTLLGIPSAMPDVASNLLILLNQYFSFNTPSAGVLMTPVYSLGAMALIILGIIRLTTTNYTARSYIISAWVLLLFPVLIVTPNFSTITFVPGMLLMAMGISSLLRSWYKLFPRNPYARVVGLIPLTILIGGMFVTGIARYAYTYTYNPDTVTHFTQDLSLINTQLSARIRAPITIAVADSEKAFYGIIAEAHDDVSVTADRPDLLSPVTIVSRLAHERGEYPPPDSIVTDTRSERADRFYIYKSDQK